MTPNANGELWTQSIHGVMNRISGRALEAHLSGREQPRWPSVWFRVHRALFPVVSRVQHAWLMLTLRGLAREDYLFWYHHRDEYIDREIEAIDWSVRPEPMDTGRCVYCGEEIELFHDPDPDNRAHSVWFVVGQDDYGDDCLANDDGHYAP